MNDESAHVRSSNDNDNDFNNENTIFQPLLGFRSRVSAELEDASTIDKLFPRAACYTFISWLILLLSVYKWTDPSHMRYLEGAEQQAAVLAASCIGLSALLLIIPMLVHRRAVSGILCAALLTQFVAFVTNCLLAWAPVPVIMDPVTYAPVYVIRWCEWTVLSGLMTFLSDSIDLRKGKGRLVWPVSTSLMQSLSCFCGLMFPFCPNTWSWVLVMIVSCVTYFTVFPRCWIKANNLWNTKKGSTFFSMERYDRAEFAFHLYSVCTIVWTVLVVVYFINMIIYRCVSESHWLRHPGLAMMVDTFFDVLAKAFYMKCIVDVHSAVFDREARAQRQLSELRRLMNALWESSSDVICISVLHEDKMTSMLSPSFTSLVGSALPEHLQNRKFVALMIETKLFNPQEARADVVSAYFVDSAEIPYGGTLRQAIIAPLNKNSSEVMRAMEIVSAACYQHSLNNCADNTAESKKLMVHPLQRVSGEELQCEIKVSEHGDHAMIAVIRDITERYRRFEAEQRAHFETAQRQKDAQAVNRFTRHEVKNGLLAGIELCDSLRSIFDSGERDNPDSVFNSRVAASRHIIYEMDNLLHEVLDTVLAEAMARDVIHEVYQPRLERVDVKSLLTSSSFGLGKSERLPLQLSKSMPYLLLDPQLLRYIHRNAFSNACKYGKSGGTVLTVVEFHEARQVLEMKVINEPGTGHDALVDMGMKASSAVFRQGTRLLVNGNGDDQNISSGDGAWIMQKCARTMGGSCQINFNRDQTVFTFCCPAEPLITKGLQLTEKFEVPQGTWGIGIDDSPIQRRLMTRILTHAGIDESKRIVLGKCPEDCAKLAEIIKQILSTDNECKILVLVDENLDFNQRDVKHIILSGSIIMKEILNSLPKAEESRVFALVRSANDSTEDVAMYLQRVHAFFPKAPMQRERVREILAPLWADRFMSPKSLEMSTCDEKSDDDIDKDDLLQSLRQVDTLLQETYFDAIPWPHLWSALHSLKGDLMVVEGLEDLDMATILISSMRGSEVPREFPTKWELIRELVVKAAEKM